MVNKIAFIILSSFILLSCEPTTQAHINGYTNHSISKFQTNKGVECIIYESGNKAGISCNWNKYNNAISKCKKEHISQFPDVKGRCENLIYKKGK
jgi:hypothetical protein